MPRPGLPLTVRVILGAVAGGVAAGFSALVAASSGDLTPFLGVVVLTIALVGLGLGATAAVWAYGIAAIVFLALSVPPEGASLGIGDFVRIASFVVGSPFVILLALRAERERNRTSLAHQASVEAERAAQADRAAAHEARAELQVALQGIERERARLEEVAGAVPEPLIVYDDEGRGIYANRAALRVFGRSYYERGPEEWGRTAEPRDERGEPLDLAAWPQVRGRRESFRRRILVRIPMSGRDLLVDVEGTPLPGGGCVLLLRDVGKEVDERRRLSRFASFVAHELRNPLAVAKARIELGNRALGRSAAGGEAGVDHGARALESVDAAIAILERLELFSRAEAGRLAAMRESFDLRAAVDASVERLRARGCERKVRVKVTGRSAVVGDQRLTEQAITNLLTNADRYSEPPDAPIDVEIRGGAEPQLRVADAGPGISDELADSLFRERVSSGSGLGLGLYLVHAVMAAQAGSVELEQRRPRAVFVLRWPGIGKETDGG